MPKPSSLLLNGDCWRVVGKHLSARDVVRLSQVDRYLWQQFSRTQKLINTLVERYYGTDEESQKRWRGAFKTIPWHGRRGRFARWQKIHLHDNDMRKWVNDDLLRQRALFRYLSSGSGIVSRPSSRRVFDDWGITSITSLTGNRLAAGTFWGIIKIWNLSKKAGQQCVARLAAHSGSVYRIRELENGTLVSCSSDHTMKIWDLAKPAEDACIMTLAADEGICDIAVLSDRRLATSSCNNRLSIWDPSLRSEQRRVGSVLTNTYNLCLEALSNGQVVCGSTDNTLKILDVSGRAGQDPVAILEGHTALVSCVLTLPDGKIASGSFDKTVKLWDMDLPPERRCISTLQHSSWIRSLAMLLDGRLVASVDHLGMVIWDLTRPEPEYAIRLQEPELWEHSVIDLNGQVITYKYHQLLLWRLSVLIDSSKSLPDGSQPQDLITCTVADAISSRTRSKTRKRSADAGPAGDSKYPKPDINSLTGTPSAGRRNLLSARASNQ